MNTIFQGSHEAIEQVVLSLALLYAAISHLFRSFGDSPRSFLSLLKAKDRVAWVFGGNQCS